MKFFLLTILFLACSTTPPQTAKIETLPTPSKETALKDLATLAQSGVVVLRTELDWPGNGSSHFILHYRNSSPSTFQVVDQKGNFLLNDNLNIPLEKFSKFVSIKGTSLVFKNAIISSVAPASYNKTEGGKIRLELPVALSKGSIILSATLALSINVASYNPSNFWDGNPDNTPANELYGYDDFKPDFSNWYEPPVQKAKARNTAYALRIAGLPEIVALQEIEWAQGKNEIFNKGSYFRNELEKLGYRYFVLGDMEANNPMPIAQAFISKYPLKDLGFVAFNVDAPEMENIAKDPKAKKVAAYTTRDTPVVELDLAGNKIHLYNNHWRSQGCNDNESCEKSDQFRIANAKVVRNAILKDQKKNPNVDIVILGDLNSGYTDTAMAALGSSDNAKAVQEGATDAFYNLWYELPPEARWEANGDGLQQTLSQIILNHSFFDNKGLQYNPKNFQVIGHTGDAKNILMNADGTPLRFQESKFRADQLTGKISELLKRTYEERKCAEKKYKIRRCKIAYLKYTGDGFSDHLPIVASFNFVGNNYSTPATTNFKFDRYSDWIQLAKIDAPVELCEKNEDAIDLAKANLKDSNLFGKCAKIDVSKNPLPIDEVGVYQNGIIQLKGGTLGLTMARPGDPRAIDESGKIINSQSTEMQPGSDMCYTRKVLHKKGGKLKYAMGRLGLYNGIVSLFIGRRADVTLSDLPEEKAVECH